MQKKFKSPLCSRSLWLIRSRETQFCICLHSLNQMKSDYIHTCGASPPMKKEIYWSSHVAIALLLAKYL